MQALRKLPPKYEAFSFGSFPADKSLYVATTLECYLTRTTQSRAHLHSGAPNPLFLSYHRQAYKPVRSCSVARWIKTFLASAGVDTLTRLRHILPGPLPQQKLGIVVSL